ncbi:MAG: 4-hydroxy-tetrahydrodipicolinate reductase [Rhodothalassiaceae bacterium]
MAIRMGIAGAAGRMGRALIAASAERSDLRLSALLVRDAGQGANLALPANADHAPDIVSAPERLFALSDIVIDFTSPAASVLHAGLAAERGMPLVLGTTGFDAKGERAIRAAAKKTALLRAANFATGIALLVHLVRKAAATLDMGYDIEILEMHHAMKRDAPSGTALALGDAAAEGRGRAASFAASDRSGIRKTGEIGFAVLRGGDVIGDHEVIFAGAGERLSLAHRATDRLVFARGALRAAAWLYGRPAGLYGLDDMLGLRAPEDRTDGE